jgi:hypothetical protein
LSASQLGSAQNSPAAFIPSTASTSVTASGISEHLQHAFARRSSTCTSSLSSIAPVSEVNHAPPVFSCKEKFADPQTCETTPVSNEDFSKKNNHSDSKTKLRILFSPRPSNNSSTSSDFSSSITSSSASTAVSSKIKSEVNLALFQSRSEISAVPQIKSNEATATNQPIQQTIESLHLTPYRSSALALSNITNTTSTLSSAIGKRKPVQFNIKNKKKKKGKGLLW